MMKDVLKPVLVALILTIAGASGGYLSGYYTDLTEAHKFFADVNGVAKADTTLRELSASLETCKNLGNEYQQLMRLMQTLTGNCTVQIMNDRLSAVVSRRSPFKRGDKLIVENLSSTSSERVSVTVAGDFEPRNESLLIKVSPDAGRILNIPEIEGATIRVEVKPDK